MFADFDPAKKNIFLAAVSGVTQTISLEIIVQKHTKSLQFDELFGFTGTNVGYGLCPPPEIQLVFSPSTGSETTVKDGESNGVASISKIDTSTQSVTAEIYVAQLESQGVSLLRMRQVRDANRDTDWFYFHVTLLRDLDQVIALPDLDYEIG